MAGGEKTETETNGTWVVGNQRVCSGYEEGFQLRGITPPCAGSQGLWLTSESIDWRQRALVRWRGSLAIRTQWSCVFTLNSSCGPLFLSSSVSSLKIHKPIKGCPFAPRHPAPETPIRLALTLSLFSVAQVLAGNAGCGIKS